MGSKVVQNTSLKIYTYQIPFLFLLYYINNTKTANNNKPIPRISEEHVDLLPLSYAWNKKLIFSSYNLC